MEPNDNPPSEREWTIEEMEEFFSDKYTNAYASNSKPVDSSSITLASLQQALSEYDRKFPRPDDVVVVRGIFVMSIAPPEHGWPMAMHCPICKETTFILSPWAIEPKDGGYFKMEACVSEVHNMRLAWDNLHKELASYYDE
jgi:hypothetical protein